MKTKNMINQKVLLEWIEALESGRYTQGRGTLRSVKNEFCCIGVLADLAVKKGLGSWKKSETCHTFITGPNKSSGFATVELCDYLGANPSYCLSSFDTNGLMIGPSLVDLNDTQKKPFAEIAVKLRGLLVSPKKVK